MKKLASVAAALSLAAVTSITAIAPASAQSQFIVQQPYFYSQGVDVSQDLRTDVRHRRGHRIGAGIVGGFLGFAAGAAVAGAIANSRDRSYGYDSHVARCYDRYRSYDARTDTYLGYDGRRHYCNL